MNISSEVAGLEAFRYCRLIKSLLSSAFKIYMYIYEYIENQSYTEEQPTLAVDMSKINPMIFSQFLIFQGLKHL